jgi:hypothetical protein
MVKPIYRVLGYASMKIAVIGWGSLTDKTDERNKAFPIEWDWRQDGPLLPVEFARQSKDGRITLVIIPNRSEVRCVPTLWTLMNVPDIDAAGRELARRKDTTIRNIAFWNAESSHGNSADIVKNWALDQGY